MRFKLFISLLLLITAGCVEDKPHQIQTDNDKQCIESYEKLVDLYLTDTTLKWKTQKEKWVNTDQSHQLLKPHSALLDSTCEFRGLRDYTNVMVVEVSSFVRRGYEYYETLDKIYERHLLLVGTWQKFDVNQILWSKKEKIIHEEVLSEKSKLIITQKR